MPNPLIGGRLNTSRSRDVERPKAITPVPEDYAGDNIPYRGVNNHGVAVAGDDWRDPESDMPLRPDGRLVDVYEHEEKEPEPIPVYIVNQSSRERRAFRSVVSYAGGTAYGRARMLIGADDTRTQVTIVNKSIGIGLYISDAPETANSMSGFYVKDGTSYVSSSQEAIYASADQADDLLVPMAIEYRISLDG